MRDNRKLKAISTLIVMLSVASPAIAQKDVLRGLDQLLPKIAPELQQERELKTPPEAPVASKTERWAKVERGLSDEDVEALLGKPDRVEQVTDGVRWYWENISPKGWIEFDAESREVIGWKRYF